MNIKKFTTIIKISAVRSMTYRFSVYVYRLGEIAENLIVVVMWTAIYGNETLIKGYTLNQMITYVLFGNLINVVVRNWLHTVVADDIKDGKLSMFLIKPIHYLHYILSREIGRISFAFVMSVISNMLIITLFYKKILFIFNPTALLIIFCMVILAFILELLFSFLIGLSAFWTDEVGGLFYTIDRLKMFLAGGYFPLNILPVLYVQISLCFPFAYSFFVPTQLYLGKLDLRQGIIGVGVQAVWIVLLYYIIKFVWKKGLTKYEGVGI